MVNILGNEYKLNDVICVGYKNDRGNYEIISGRIYLWNNLYVHLDCSYDFQQLEDTVRVKIDNVKYVKKTMENYWR